MTDHGEGLYRRKSDEDLPVLIHRMDALEKRVDSGFHDMAQRLDSLAFVKTETYMAHRETEAQWKVMITKEVSDNRRLITWALSGIAMIVLGSIVTALVRVAMGG